MRERNVTVVTTTMNLDGPVQQLHRVPRAHLDAHERVPEAALLREHAGHRALDARAEQLDPGHDAGVRAVRYLPGAEAGRAVLLDRFFCEGPQLKGTYVRMMERIGFKKLRWNARRKVDRGPEKPQKNQWYFSALLEKPMT
ncbi:hypothetical protein ACJRO7_026351 [Eucalyptus globulus]|uniref:Uncharacterized protein n=1 Tax=Eucalyptus globulus TaxID=34317 RepID=A0ABD3JSK4_EUCGL